MTRPSWLMPPEKLYSVEIRERPEGARSFGPWTYLEGHIYRFENLARSSAAVLVHRLGPRAGRLSDDVETESRVVSWTRGAAR